jgi:tetratricopeptide (TPR) repeat protein
MRNPITIVKIIALNISLAFCVLIFVGRFNVYTKVFVAFLALLLFGGLKRSVTAAFAPGRPGDGADTKQAAAIHNEGQSLLRPIRQKHYQPGELVPTSVLSEDEVAALRRAVECFKNARALEQQQGNEGRLNAAIALREQGVAMRMLQAMTEAQECLRCATKELEEMPVGWPPSVQRLAQLQSGLGWCVIELGDVETLLGNFESARGRIERAKELCDNSGDRYLRSEILRLRKRLKEVSGLD